MSASGWSTFHGDTGRTGFVEDSSITAATVGDFTPLHVLEIGGSILSVPAVTNGHVYVGTANGMKDKDSSGADGGTLQKIELASGDIVKTFTWETARHEGDSHGFTGMGCTPTIVDGRVYFIAFNGKLYCLDDQSFDEVWVTDLRREDSGRQQPVTNTFGANATTPQAEGWSSPLVVNGRVYVGIGEGENPLLYSFIFCLDAANGNVEWIFCTNQFVTGADNEPNVLPKGVVRGALPSAFSTFDGEIPRTMMGCSVWGAISYDADLDRVYCATGNFPNEEEEKLFSTQGNVLPAPGYAYSILALDARTGSLKARFQAIPESSYRPSDLDVDFGTSPVVFDRGDRKVVAAACKNGGLFILDAVTLDLIDWTQLLPFRNNEKNNGKTGDRIATVDPHSEFDDLNHFHIEVSNEQSDECPAENFHGTYSTPAIDPKLGRIFVGTGGNNYHWVAGGIDTPTTPFMRAYDWTTLKDVWPLTDEDPRRYNPPKTSIGFPMYQTPGEAGLSSPAVVNDVVFCSTTKIALYAFSTVDGRVLWEDQIGMPTGGFSGGYGYCMGPAVCGDYVVAGGLVLGRDGGVLKIYGVGKRS